MEQHKTYDDRTLPWRLAYVAPNAVRSPLPRRRAARREGSAVAPQLTMQMVIAFAGLYGLIAYQTAVRTREIGIRVALGANPRDILM